MQDFQQRVVDEKNDLDGKIERLDLFIPGEMFASLPTDERIRLRLQRVYMKQYSEVLGERIAAF